jgi:hypothetical protein
MKVILHSFAMGDVEDVSLYAAQPIWEWQQSDQGQWATENCEDLQWQTSPDMSSFGHRVTITGTISDPIRVTEYLLKWQPKKS